MRKPETSESYAAQEPSLYRFVGQLFVWLAVCFIVWVLFSSVIAAPAVWFAEVILTYFIPEFVQEFTLNGTQAMLVTQFGELDGEIVAARLAGYHIAFPLNTQILTYAFPFYTALSYVTPGGENLGRFARGTLMLYALLVVGMISISLKNLMIGLGPVFIDGYSTTASIIGMMSQFSTLMIPPLAPVLVWAWQSRHSTFLQQLLYKSRVQGSIKGLRPYASSSMFLLA